MSYPLPVFHFSVTWGGTQMAFSEVTGLNTEIQAIEYRDGFNPEFSVTKTPGLRKFGNITFKRGVFRSLNDYYDWVKLTVPNNPERRDIVISLLDEKHAPVMTWKVVRAWPTKFTSPDLKANANEAAIESIEVVHEGVTVEVA